MMKKLPQLTMLLTAILAYTPHALAQEQQQPEGQRGQDNPVQTVRNATQQYANSQEGVTSPEADPDREAWRQAVLNTPRPRESCATANYPDRRWYEVPCEPPPYRPVTLGGGLRPAIVGGGGPGSDFLLATVNGIIAEGEGSFDKVTGVTSEKDGQTSNSFSLQLNTNIFATASCGSSRIAMAGCSLFTTPPRTPRSSSIGCCSTGLIARQAGPPTAAAVVLETVTP